MCAYMTDLIDRVADVCEQSSSVMRVLGSGYTGFGLFSLSLDWSVIGSTGGVSLEYAALPIRSSVS